jgi:hypothetical protein
MSLMLVYFEIGKQVDIALPRLPIVPYLTKVRLKIDGPTRHAYVMTDGHSSERFLAYGQKVIAREGSELRRSFIAFVAARLAACVDPHFIFVTFSGPIGDPISLTISKQIDARLTDLEKLFSLLQPNQLVRIIHSKQMGCGGSPGAMLLT